MRKQKQKEASVKITDMDIPIEDGDRGDINTEKSDEVDKVDKLEPASSDTEKVLLDPLEKIKELEDQKLRLVAELDNYRKRTVKQFRDITQSANDRLFTEVLEIIDNFDRALKHANEQPEGEDPKAFRHGVDLIFNQMNDLLIKYDVIPIDAVGQIFDPTLHEALMQVDSNEYEEGIIALEINRGYRIGKRVLRHSKVGVSKGKSKEQKEKVEQDKQ